MGSQNITSSFSKVKLVSTKKKRPGTDMNNDGDERLQSEGVQESSNRRIFNSGQKVLLGSMDEQSFSHSPRRSPKRSDTSMFGIPTVEDNGEMEYSSRVKK